EILLYVGFSTGAYIFGGDYPTDLFQRFFNELKTYSPKYQDSSNKYLYYSLDNAGIFFNQFNDIFKKYNDINREEFKQRKIKKMEDELN
ncbi:hypothetical protein U2086_14745, partial [Listeria monocytogenes]|uniref:hypothetical protein n=1 Tax=Listeria monocytogenes TaxID=1639 RepID=UPI002FDC3D34